MTSYEAFLPHLLPMVPNAPEPSAIIAVRNACIEFCKNTLLLQQQMDTISVAMGVPDYEIDVPQSTTLVQVVKLYYCGTLLPRRTVSELSARFSRDWMLMSGTPSCYTQLNGSEVKLVYMPDQNVTDALTGLIALAPTRESTSADDQLFDDYLDEIVRGAAARLCALPNQPFTDTKAAFMYNRQFSADVANARAHVTAGQTRAPMRVRATRI